MLEMSDRASSSEIVSSDGVFEQRGFENCRDGVPSVEFILMDGERFLDLDGVGVSMVLFRRSFFELPGVAGIIIRLFL